MLLIDNLVKGWHCGAIVGDSLFGHITATPGFIIDGIWNGCTSEKYQYEWHSLNYSDAQYASFSRIFAFPGKVIGNTIIPIIFAAIAFSVFFPNLILRSIDKFYHFMKDTMDKVINFICSLSTDRQDLNYLEKNFYLGYALLGNIVGGISSIIGLVLDQLCGIIGIKTQDKCRKAFFTAGEKIGGFLGGVATGIIGACIYPFKQILDKAFSCYRYLRNTIDNIAATLLSKHNYTANIQIDGHDSPHIYSKSFRTKMTQAKYFSWGRYFKDKFSLQQHNNSEQHHNVEINGIGQDPLTLEKLSNPIMICNSGHNVNLTSAEQVKQYGSCPCCRGDLLPQFIPNIELKNAIEHQQANSLMLS